MMWLLLSLACSPETTAPDPTVGAQPSEIPELVLDLAEGPLSTERYSPFPMNDFTIYPVSFLLRPGFGVSGALYIPEEPKGPGVLVTHGHFGEGKSGTEAQEIAHRLAASGVRVLAVDTPGVEERERPGRVIHDEAGAHNRGWLISAGSHAMALQLSVLRRGLDLLEAEGATRIGVTGASGGAVQAFYLALIESRVDAVVLASMPRVPREARAGGCPCDQIPGRPGPEPGLLMNLKQPTLWLSEVPQASPEGLVSSARFEVIEGPHGYAPAMQRASLDFLGEHLRFSVEPWTDGDLDLVDLRTPGTLGVTANITDLPLGSERAWVPAPWTNVPYEYECRGDGPAVAVVGGSPDDLRAIHDVGLRACRVSLPVDELGLEEAVGLGKVYADRQAGGLKSAAEKAGAVAVWSVGAWGHPASAVGLPYVIRDPVSDLSALNASREPAWIHTPGAWWGGAQSIVDGALQAGHSPELLARTLAERVGGARSAGEGTRGGQR